jgi:hypothetical protein
MRSLMIPALMLILTAAAWARTKDAPPFAAWLAAPQAAEVVAQDASNETEYLGFNWVNSYCFGKLLGCAVTNEPATTNYIYHEVILVSGGWHFYLERLLKNPFYKGQFIREDKLYSGTHTPLISAELFAQVQAVFRGHNKPKYRKHDFAFAGLLRCAYDNCAVTAELQKNRYTYYRCTGFRGKCELPYFREEEPRLKKPNYSEWCFRTALWTL